MENNKELEKFASYVRLTWDRGLTESTGGNISIRIDNKIYLTPTIFVKHFFTVDDMVEIDMKGNKLSGNLDPSLEIKMHLSLYNAIDDINSVFHAHPRYALICTINKIRIQTRILPETFFMFSDITYLPYTQPGTDKFAQRFVSNAKKEAMFSYWKIMV